jgi:hypothetical protein
LQDDRDCGVDQPLDAKEQKRILMLEDWIQWRAATDQMDFHGRDESFDEIDLILTLSLEGLRMCRAVVDNCREREDHMSTENN